MTPGRVGTVAALGTGLALQYAVPKDKQVSVARGIVKASDLYTTFSNGSVPTPAQFQLALHNYLPENNTKALTELTLAQIYAENYQYFKDREPTVQLAYATSLLLGARSGASSFTGTP